MDRAPLPPCNIDPSNQAARDGGTPNSRQAIREARKRRRVVIDWRYCVLDIVSMPEIDVYVQLPSFIAPLPLPFPALCIHVVIDPKIPIGVPYIANRQVLMQRTMREDVALGYINFEHCHNTTEETFGENISAGTFHCHPHDVLIVEGWRSCESMWYDQQSKYLSMAIRGKTIRDLWPWVREFNIVCLQ